MSLKTDLAAATLLIESQNRLIESQLLVIANYQHQIAERDTRYRVMLNHVSDLEELINAINAAEVA